MPANVIKAWSHGSKEKAQSLEGKWKKAKTAASEQGGKKNKWAYRMAIFKKMAHHEDFDPKKENPDLLSLREYILNKFKTEE